VTQLEIGKVLVILRGHIWRVGITFPIVLGVDVKALCVAGIPDRRVDGTSAPPVVDIVPVYVAKERVLLDFGRAAADVA